MKALVGQASDLLGHVLERSGAADRSISAYFHAHRNLGQRDRAFIAEAVYAALRRKRSLAVAAGSDAPRALVLAALVRVLGYSGRALDEALGEHDRGIIARVRATPLESMPEAVQADLPDWFWNLIASRHGATEAMRIARSLLEPAPLDLRVNLARITRDEAHAQLASSGIEAGPGAYSPASLRLKGKPAINQHPLFKAGLVEVQDEGSQLLAYLVAPRRGEMVADFCAGAGGKTLAMAMLMRSSGRLYAMDVSAKRLASLTPRLRRAAVSNVHPVVLDSENDERVKRLAGKLDRVLVDAPCSGFGTLRRNPDLKWRHGPEAVEQLRVKQARILESAARLVKPGGRLVYATCSLLEEENESIADRFAEAHGEFRPLHCGELLAEQRIPLESAGRLRLWPHIHRTDGFFAAAFERAASGHEKPPRRASKRGSDVTG
ncbi:MAG: RsmB/NOP family class I SAM-dependent RNA methyltransferase [Burkholderiales bacterium]